MDLENLSLAEIVTSKPEAASLLENYNLDFCCRGKQKLSEALKNDSDKLKEVTASLETIFNKATPPETDFNRFSLTHLVDYIVETHHRYAKENLPVIEQHLQKVAFKHGAKHPEMMQINVLFEEMKRDFEMHMMKEEMILFPRIKKVEAANENGIALNENLKGPVSMMEFEHETAGKIMENIKSLCNNYTPPADACVTFRLCLEELKIFESDLHQHVHLENNILFPKAVELQNNLTPPSCSCSI